MMIAPAAIRARQGSALQALPSAWQLSEGAFWKHVKQAPVGVVCCWSIVSQLGHWPPQMPQAQAMNASATFLETGQSAA
jgi:hypothetical protein